MSDKCPECGAARCEPDPTVPEEITAYECGTFADGDGVLILGESCMGNQNIQLKAENAKLLEELAIVLNEIICNVGHYDDGWWDTLAMSSAMEAGDRLVELGLWERKPGGHGRRQFYRPITAAKEARDG